MSDCTYCGKPCPQCESHWSGQVEHLKSELAAALKLLYRGLWRMRLINSTACVYPDPRECENHRWIEEAKDMVAKMQQEHVAISPEDLKAGALADDAMDRGETS